MSLFRSGKNLSIRRCSSNTILFTWSADILPWLFHAQVQSDKIIQGYDWADMGDNLKACICEYNIVRKLN